MVENRWVMLGKRVAAVHRMWTELTSDLIPEHVNHHERPGVLPIAFSLFHFVNAEDRSVAQRILGEPELWSSEWASRTGIGLDAIKRGAPMEVAERVRITDMSAWRAYQSAVFARTEAAMAAIPAGRWHEEVFSEVPDNLRGGFIAHLAGDGPIYLGD